MTFPHSVTGVTRQGFTCRLVKNGDLITSVGITTREVSPFLYVASFTDDGSDNTSWALVVSDPNVPQVYYGETWFCQKPIIAATVKYLRTLIDSRFGNIGNGDN